MTDDSGSLWSTAKRTTVAVIVTALVGGVLSWIAGWLPALWQAVVVAVAWAWELLTAPLPVPFAVLVILCLLFVWIGRATKRKPVQTPPVAGQEPTKRSPPALNGEELELLRLLATADGRFVGFEDTARRLRVSRLVLERNCEALAERGLVNIHPNDFHGPQLTLTRGGRDFVIEQGFHLGL